MLVYSDHSAAPTLKALHTTVNVRNAAVTLFRRPMNEAWHRFLLECGRPDCPQCKARSTGVVGKTCRRWA